MAEIHVSCLLCGHTHFSVHFTKAQSKEQREWDFRDYVKLTCTFCSNEQLYAVDLSPEFERFMEEIGL